MFCAYVCGTERAARHKSKHMADSSRRRTPENVTEWMMLIFICSTQAAVQLCATNAASVKAQWAHAAPPLHMHSFCAAYALLAHSV